MVAAGWLTDRLPELWQQTGAHLMLVGVSTGFAILIGLPLGILVFRKTWLRGPVVGAVGVLQTIPSLAMLAILLAATRKIGALPAMIALTLYALLPIVRNTLAGLQGVPAEAVEAARGIGMTEHQQLWMVRMPLAMPIVVAGVRTAAVIGVGIATLSAFIGAPGLGVFINRGLAMRNISLLLLGAVPAALLAVLVNFVISAAEWGMRPSREAGKKAARKARLRPLAVALPFLLVGLGIAVHMGKPSVQGKVGTIRIGSKNFTEQLIIGELMAQLIEAKTDLAVQRRFNLGGTMICHGALDAGEIDVYAEYTGTGLTAILKAPVVGDPDEAFRQVAKAYRERFDVEWLRPFGFNNTYAITVRETDAAQNGWTKISDLRGGAADLRAGFTAEFMEREDGYPGLRKAYALEFRKVHDLDPSLMYDAVAKSEVDVICAFATDGRIAAYNLKPLEDDRGFFPPYYAAPVVRMEVLRAFPEVRDALELLAGALDDATMQRLNYEVDKNKRAPAEVARTFLDEHGLLKGE